jgi:putative redox protein
MKFSSKCLPLCDSIKNVMRIELKRLDDSLHFEAQDEAGHAVHIDGAPNIGGNDKGVRPMQLLIMGLGGCSAIDVVMILKKQRQVIDDFSITIDGEREVGKEPSLWKDIQIHFKLKGQIDPEKAQRAVSLSVEKYCSVAKTLEAAGATITYKVSVNE